MVPRVAHRRSARREVGGSAPWAALVALLLLPSVTAFPEGPGAIHAAGLRATFGAPGGSNGAPAGAPSQPTTVLSMVPDPTPFSVGTNAAEQFPPAATVGRSLAYPGLYNAGAATAGQVRIEEGPGAAPVEVSVDLDRAAAASPGIVGYPEFQYGPKPWCARAPCPSAPESPALELPEKVVTLPSIYGVLSYRFGPSRGPTAGEFDLAFDLWLTRAYLPARAGPGDVELMVWLDYHGTDLLPGPPEGRFAAPADVNGSWTDPTWLDYVQDGGPSSPAGHWTVVYLILEDPIGSGTVGLDLTQLIDRAGTILTVTAPGPWAAASDAGIAGFGGLYLNDVEIGSEFRPDAPGGPVLYEWTLSAYCLETRSGAALPASGALTDACRGAGSTYDPSAPRFGSDATAVPTALGRPARPRRP